MSDRTGGSYTATTPIETETGVVAPVMGRSLGRAGPAASHALPARHEPAVTSLRKIKAVVLLSGSVRQSELRRAIGRAMLELPITPTTSFLDVWRRHALRMARLADVDRIPMRILSDGLTPMPRLIPGDAEMGITVERDPISLRGTGGVLRDISEIYEDEDYLLVATAAQVLLEPLGELAVALQRSGGDVALMAHGDGTPSSLMLVRCGSLRQIAAMGFVDMKEQALPRIAAAGPTSVLTRIRPVGLQVRTLHEYTRALHLNQRVTSGATDVHGAFAETWHSTVAIAEPGSNVHPRVRLHDSVVLCGGCVEDGAVLVRSMVCPGGVVRRGRVVVDSLITSHRDRG